MSFKSMDMSGKKLDEAKNFLKTAANEMQKGNADLEEVKRKLLKAQEKLYSDSGETSQKLAKDVNDTFNKIASALNSTDGTQRQKLNDALADVSKVNKTIEKEKDTRASVDTKTSSIISSLAGRLSSAAGGLNFSGKYQSSSGNTTGAIRMRASSGGTISDVGYGSGGGGAGEIPHTVIDTEQHNFRTLLDKVDSNTFKVQAEQLMGIKGYKGQTGKDTEAAYSRGGFDTLKDESHKNKVYIDGIVPQDKSKYAIPGIAKMNGDDIARLYGLTETIYATNGKNVKGLSKGQIPQKGPVDGQVGLDTMLVDAHRLDSTILCTSQLSDRKYQDSTATITSSFVVSALPLVAQNLEEIKAVSGNLQDVKSIEHLSTSTYSWTIDPSKKYGGDYSAKVDRYEVTYTDEHKTLLTTAVVDQPIGHNNNTPIIVAPLVDYLLEENKQYTPSNSGSTGGKGNTIGKTLDKNINMVM